MRVARLADTHVEDISLHDWLFRLLLGHPAIFDFEVEELLAFTDWRTGGDLKK